MNTETTAAAISWPWRMKVTYTDGSVREDDYSASPDLDPVALARFLSGKPDVDRVELATMFVAGEQISPVMDPKPPTLTQRITAALIAAKFIEYSPTDSLVRPRFVVSEGVGATVGVAWVNASKTDRAFMVTQYEEALRASGLTVENRGDDLYVAKLDEAAGAIEDLLTITKHDPDIKGEQR